LEEQSIHESSLGGKTSTGRVETRLGDRLGGFLLTPKWPLLHLLNVQNVQTLRGDRR